MTEGSGPPPQRKGIPGNSTRSGFLVVGILLAAVVVVFALIYQQGLAPELLLPSTPNTAETLPLETGAPETTPPGYTSLVETLTAGPLAQTPTLDASLVATLLDAETPVPPATSAPSPTPAYGSCQYKLKSSPSDFLYAIYWNWHINKNISDVQEFYTRIHCADLTENIACNYHPGDPDTIFPGWILVLPGVNANICTYHGGTPVP